MEIPLISLGREDVVDSGIGTPGNLESTFVIKNAVSLVRTEIRKRLAILTNEDDLKLLRKLNDLLGSGNVNPLLDLNLSRRTDEIGQSLERRIYTLVVTTPPNGDDHGKHEPNLLSFLQEKFDDRFDGVKAKLQYPDPDPKTTNWIWFSSGESGVLPDEKGEVQAMLTFKEYTTFPEWKGKSRNGLSQRLYLYLCFERGSLKRKLAEELSTANQKMLKLEIASDVVIVAENGKEFKCHKSFLSSHSPVLQAMLLSGMEETRTSRIVVPDLSEKVVEVFLQYLYTRDTSEVNGDFELCFGLLYAGHKYEVKCLEQHAIQLLEDLENDDYTVDFALKLFVFLGNVPGSEELKKKTATVMLKNFDELAALPEYDDLHKKTMKELMKYIVIAKVDRE